MEMWKSVKGYEEIYEVSNLGKFKSLSREKFCGHKGSKAHITKERILATSIDRRGYLRVKLSRDGRSKLSYVHRLLAINFIDNPKNKKEINHIDGIKANNSLDNLEWSTRSKNMKHAFKMGLKKPKRGIDNNKTKLTEAEVLEIRHSHKNSKITQTQLGKDFNVTTSTINYIVNRKTWTHI